MLLSEGTELKQGTLAS